MVIHDLETEDQKEIEIQEPQYCATSQHSIAVTTYDDGMHLYSTDSVLVHIVPDSTEASCVAFHSSTTGVLAVGYGDGTVRSWDLRKQVYAVSFKEHTYGISNIRFEPYGRLFLSSYDKTASIVTLDDQLQIVSLVKLEGHTDRVYDILPLFSANKCVTCSVDMTIKVWDCETGVCLRTLYEHTYWVMSLAMHPSGQHFVSGSLDQAVVIWSSETFEVLRRITFPNMIPSLVFGESDTLYVGVYDHGVMSCNVLTGEVGPAIITGTGMIPGLALGKTLCMYCTVHTTHSHS